MRLLLKNGNIWQSGSFFCGDLAVEDGVISYLGGCVSSEPFDQVFDCSGQFIFPGLADVHVHFREPGFFYKESIKTGSLAAAKGGVTSVCTMPNLNPPPDTPAHLQEQLDLIAKDACVDVHPVGCITLGQMGAGDLVDFEALAPHVAAFSDDGRGVQAKALMQEAMTQIAKTGKVLAAHCEDDELRANGYIHKGSYAAAHGHAGISSESEWKQVERDLALAEQTGCAYHVCHISTKESVDLLRKAKQKGLDVSGETGPHYLFFTQDDLQEDGRFKMNPPLRDADDRDALIEGLLDGTLEMIATDHAPHSQEEKAKGLAASAMGVVGLETSLAACYTALVLSGKADLPQLVEWMSINPRKRFGLGGGSLNVGDRADLICFDPGVRWQVDPTAFASKGKSTPFAGVTLNGRVTLTVLDDRVIWQDPNAFAKKGN